MKTWIDWMSHVVGGMLFQGGYVASPTLIVAGLSSPVTGDAPPGRVEHPCRRANAAPAVAESVQATQGRASHATRRVGLA